MLPPDSDLLEQTAKVVAICGPLVTAGKSIVLFAKDQSLDRKGRKKTEEISECLNRFQTLQSSLSATDLQLEPYRRQIMGDLHFLISELSAVQEKRLLREEKKDKESKGIRRWFLLYRPEGIDGWITQSFFFGTWAALVFILITSFREIQRDFGEFVFSTVLIGLWLLYARSVSLRLKDVQILKRRTGTRELNSDLHWIARVLLLFKPTGGAALTVHVFFYIFALNVIVVPPDLSASLQVIGRVSALLTAKLFQIDALARRAQTKFASSSEYGREVPSQTTS